VNQFLRSTRLVSKELIWLVAVASSLACQGERKTSAHQGQPLATAKSETARATPAEPSARQEPSVPRRTAPSRVVAVGDLHGDLQAARRAFRAAKVTDESDRWIGGDSVVVQTGDVLDRGDEERALLEWLDGMEGKAKQAGGAIHRLNGNHEVMNVAGDLRYVAEKGFLDFAQYATGSLPEPLARAPAAHRGRLKAFLPGGTWARRLSEFPVVLVVNDTLFAHGGVVRKHVEYGLDRINTEVSAWMRGVRPLPQALAEDEAPFWDRTYGDDVSARDCQRLEEVLAALSAKRLVVGHTPQKNGVTFACDKRVARIDVGLSSFYGSNPAAVLEINGDEVAVLTEKPGSTPLRRPAAAGRAEARP